MDRSLTCGKRFGPVRVDHLEDPMFVSPRAQMVHRADFEADTEIDWVAYMQQIEIYLKGERNYYNIEGDTGPLVYPGLHVYIYRILYAVTGQGQNILVAQILFAILYLVTLAVVIACYRRAKVSQCRSGLQSQI